MLDAFRSSKLADIATLVSMDQSDTYENPCTLTRQCNVMLLHTYQKEDEVSDEHVCKAHIARRASALGSSKLLPCVPENGHSWMVNGVGTVSPWGYDIQAHDDCKAGDHEDVNN